MNRPAPTREDLLKAIKKDRDMRSNSGTGVLTHSSDIEQGVTKVEGRLRITKIDAVTGEKTIHLDEKLETNLVVTLAESIMAKMAAGIANSPIAYIELGTGTTPPALTDITLQTPIGVPEKQATTDTASGNVAHFQATWGVGDGNGNTFREAGLFTGPFPGTGEMFARKVFSALTKNAGFSFIMDWYISFTVQAGSGGCTGIAVIGNTITAENYYFVAVGGELNLVVPIDFVVGATRLEVFQNGVRLVPNVVPGYHEAVIGPSKGIVFDGFALIAADKIYVRHLRIA
jgi:hypothetical protein